MQHRQNQHRRLLPKVTHILNYSGLEGRHNSRDRHPGRCYRRLDELGLRGLKPCLPSGMLREVLVEPILPHLNSDIGANVTRTFNPNIPKAKGLTHHACTSKVSLLGHDAGGG